MRERSNINEDVLKALRAMKICEDANSDEILSILKNGKNRGRMLRRLIRDCA